MGVGHSAHDAAEEGRSNRHPRTRRPGTKLHLHFPKVAIHLGIVPFAALALQIVVVDAPTGLGDTARRSILVLSYVLLLGFVLANLHWRGLIVIGAGLFLNFLAIISNGGLMPISPDTLERSGLPQEEVSAGEWVPHSKDVLLTREETNLWPLSDILVWKNPTGVNAFSVGDLVIGAGLLVTLGEVLLPSVRRVSADGPSAT